MSTDLPLPPATSVFTFTTRAQREFVQSAFTYGFYLGLGKDVFGSRRFDTSDTWSNGPTHGIRSGRVQLWRSHRLIARWLRSLRTLPAGPYCPLRSGNCVLCIYMCIIYIIYMRVIIHVHNLHYINH